MRFSNTGEQECIWTCTSKDCLTREGPWHCKQYLLTTSIERMSSDDMHQITTSCRYGDSVKLQRNSAPDGDLNFFVREIAITSKEGEIRLGKWVDEIHITLLCISAVDNI